MREPSRLDPAVRAYLESENAYGDAILAGTRPLQETLLAEMKGRIKVEMTPTCRPWTGPIPISPAIATAASIR